MDPIIGKLNQAASKKILKQGFSGEAFKSDGPSGFQKKFDETLSSRLLDKMKENYGLGAENEMQVLSADNVQIKVDRSEIGGTDLPASEKYFDYFKDINKDLLSLDSAIETLTTPGLKMTPRQLLALQAGVANTTIMAEGFSRFTDAVARGIQTVVQTQVG